MLRRLIILIMLIFASLGGFIVFRTISLSQTPNRPAKAGGTGQTDVKSQAQVLAVNNLRHATLAIDGMWCSSCAVGAEYALKEKTGVVNATVGFKENLGGTGEVIYNPKQIDLEEITKAVEPYKAKVISDKQAMSTNFR